MVSCPFLAFLRFNILNLLPEYLKYLFYFNSQPKHGIFFEPKEINKDLTYILFTTLCK